jgi:tricorn protease
MRMPAHSVLRRLALLAAIVLPTVPLLAADAPPLHRGYYSEPALHGDTVVFTSEGDLWTVDIHGGAARRLTSGTGTEHNATISPDGRTVAFRANYEGPNDVYTMPIDGGLPQRRTWDGESRPAGWGPDGRLLVATGRYSTLPGSELLLLDDQGAREPIPLAQAAEGVYAGDGHTLVFTRWFRQGSQTKRYKGGTAENIWSFDGTNEAVPLTADFAGTSSNPMFWNGRVYFLSDRAGVMNVYSMDLQGHGVRAESHQRVFDVRSAALFNGRIVYASGADLWRLDLSAAHEEVIPITLVSDFDQMREHWVRRPLDYISQVHISPDGSRAVFTARGEIFTLPAKTGRIVKVAGDSAVRYREASFLPDGKSIVALSTTNGETEFWKFAADGESAPEQWTHDAKVLRWEGVPSPDGHWLAHHDKDRQLWLYDITARQDKRIAQSLNDNFANLSWSPDSHWLAYTETADNLFAQIKVLNVDSGASHTLTSDRYNSVDPVWSSDGRWLYFLSDRNLRTTIPSPWGPRQPAPHFDRTLRIYELALTPGLRSPFLPTDELHPDTPEKKDGANEADTAAADRKAGAVEKKVEDERRTAQVRIDFTDLGARLGEIPAPPGNYNILQATPKRLCWLDASDEVQRKLALQCLDIANKGDELETVLPDVKDFEISLDRKKMLISKGDNFYVVDSAVKAAALADPKVLPKAAIDLSHWQLSTIPREEYRGIFLDAWRLERDYFYDRNMHGVNWVTMRDRYLPLVERVANRDELNDLIAQMVGELSALHSFVSGGDARRPSDAIGSASLGAVLHRDDKAGGFVVDHVYLHDPDLPGQAPPLARPESRVSEGEVVVSIDGQRPLDIPDERALLRGKAGQQVMLQVKSRNGGIRDVLVRPIDGSVETSVRYAEWEYTRRLKVEAASQGEIGYVHLRAMGSNDIERWARDYYPVFNRPGLIIDVRHNGGGNIDSWLLSDLLRKAWFYWQPRLGNPKWNMQYAFRGHIVVLCDEATASDGEAFTEGFKHFQLGKVLGTRTWGGEVWLTSSNTQADKGLASAGEIGVYADGKWIIEGHGVEPDVLVDNLPHATFGGSDAQLQAAIDLLKQQIKDDPRPVPDHPPYPDKSFKELP